MRAYQVQSPTGPDGLQLVDLPEPQPAPGHVLVRVRAVSLNYRDLLVARGQYGGGSKPGVIPTSDGAGEVVAAGEGVTRFQPGDRVAGCFFLDWESGEITPEKMRRDQGGRYDGMLRELVALPESAAVPLPAHLSFEEGATLPCAALTAWHALVTKGGVKAGDVVLTLGTGGVSIFALQLAKLHGARVILTSASDEKLARARALGADETINYRATPDWEKAVWALSGKRGVDHVIEVGGAGTLEKSLACTRYGGRVSLIGVLSGFSGQVNPLPVLFKSLTMQGIYVGSREMFEAMNRAIAASELRPVIDRVFPFDEAPDAYRYLDSGSHFGKVVITL
jgi:NADPH:quinone reductase-like Zn-dependent oxidoreductase